MVYTDGGYRFQISAPPGWAIRRGVFDPLMKRLAGRRVKFVPIGQSFPYIWVRVFDAGGTINDAGIKQAALLYVQQRGFPIITSGAVTVGSANGFQVTYKNPAAECCRVLFGKDKTVYAIELAADSLGDVVTSQTVFFDFMACVGSWRFLT